MGEYLTQYELREEMLNKEKSEFLSSFIGPQLPSYNYPPSSGLSVSSVVKGVGKEFDYNYSETL